VSLTGFSSTEIVEMLERKAKLLELSKVPLFVVRELLVLGAESFHFTHEHLALGLGATRQPHKNENQEDDS
jgi:hypothetical protein